LRSRKAALGADADAARAEILSTLPAFFADAYFAANGRLSLPAFCQGAVYTGLLGRTARSVAPRLREHHGDPYATAAPTAETHA
jgi:hypothetical protein